MHTASDCRRKHQDTDDAPAVSACDFLLQRTWNDVVTSGESPAGLPEQQFSVPPVTVQLQKRAETESELLCAVAKTVIPPTVCLRSPGNLLPVPDSRGNVRGLQAMPGRVSGGPPKLHLSCPGGRRDLLSAASRNSECSGIPARTAVRMPGADSGERKEASCAVACFPCISEMETGCLPAGFRSKMGQYRYDVPALSVHIH